MTGSWQREIRIWTDGSDGLTALLKNGCQFQQELCGVSSGDRGVAEGWRGLRLWPGTSSMAGAFHS